MRTYRLYRLYRLDEWGRIGFAEDIVAESDEEALELASDASPNAKKCELWEGRRLVAAITDDRWALESAQPQGMGAFAELGGEIPQSV